MMKQQLIDSSFDDRNTVTGTLLSKRLNYQFHLIPDHSSTSSAIDDT